MLAEPTLTAEQEATARRVEEQLMAPCCFGSTVATHFSPAADAIRREVRSLVAQGAHEQEILGQYLDRYGERILAQPVARGFNRLAYWMPAVGWLCGTAAVALWIRRRRRRGAPEGRPANQADDSDEARLRQRRLEDELAAFDA
jgi:cytochrome c-type biogenesis protein CcmH